jgi:adhesin/invasin
VFRDGAASPAATLTVAATAPHIFIFGANRAAVRNPDTSINTAANPALPTSVVTAYFTGIGPVDNPVPDGQPAPTSPLARSTQTATATIGGQDAPVSFIGLTPQSVGLAQANVTVPNLPPGDYPIVLTIGGVPSNAPLVTIGPAAAAAH